MELILSLAIGILSASGIWLLLRPRSFQVIIGLCLLSYAVNLFIFSMGRLTLGAPAQPDAPRLYAFTTKGSQPFHAVQYRPGDAFLFGPESRGLPPEIREALPPEQRVRLPMRPGCRSLNLSNTVAVTVYEAWRQQGFAGGE